MPRDAEATKRRLLEAAAAEFAERGIAGARIDRIAAAAGANKKRRRSGVDAVRLLTEGEQQ